jgi:hypothetical protein
MRGPTMFLSRCSPLRSLVRGARVDAVSRWQGLGTTRIEAAHLCRGLATSRYNIRFRAIFARAAPMADFTSFSSSGGGSTAGMPSDSIHSSRPQPVV